MQYAILCYHEEDVVWSWSKAEEQVVMDRLTVVQDRLVKTGKMGTSLRLLPTTAATTLRKTQEPPLVIDGPFAETKEQLLGFYVIDFDSLEEALETAKEMGQTFEQIVAAALAQRIAENFEVRHGTTAQPDPDSGARME